MRHLIVIPFLISLVGNLSAQTIARITPSTSDALFILEAMGVEMLRFDLSKLQDSTYNMGLYVDEYVDGVKQKREWNMHMGKNRMVVSEEYAQELRDAGTENFDSINNLLLCHKDVGLYILPKNDSTVMCQFKFTDGGAGGFPLSLKELKYTSPRFQYSYGMRPFRVDEHDLSKQEIPLMLYASYWYDENAKVYRFCGDNEINPDMSTEMLTYLPHYYVIGISIVKE